MKSILKIVVLTLFFYSFNSIHKDRIERPKSIEFTFTNKEHLVLTLNDLKKYDEDILSGKLKVKEAILNFETGEILKITSKRNKWKSITISYKDKSFEVPNETLSRIPEIHFSSIALVWSDDSKEALESQSFHIEMDIGKERSFAKLPSLSLSFDDDKFSGASVWKGVSEKSIQWRKF